MTKAKQEIFTAATLFERPPPEGYIEDWQARLSRARSNATENTTAAVVFRIGDEWLALPNTAVAEIVAASTPHRLPHRDNTFLLGLVNIRGELSIAVSLHALLGIQPEATDNDKTDAGRLQRPPRQLVLNAPGGALVMPVDEVAGMAFITQNALEAVPDTLRKSLTSFVHALFKHHDHTVGLLDEVILCETLNHKLG